MHFIKQSEFKARRTKLMQQMTPNSIAVLWAAPEYLRNGDSTYAYRQNSHFHYLTGYPEPMAAMILIPGRPEGEFIFFNEPNNPDYEIWVGKRIGQEGACQEYDANEAHPIEKMSEILSQLLEGKTRLYYSVGISDEWDKQITQSLAKIRARVRSGVGCPQDITNIDHLIDELRLIKSASEIQTMRHIGELSAQAHIQGMLACKTAINEYQVEAALWHHLAMHGCRQWAYTPIVGIGKNACVLHYIQNDAPLVPGELLLVDAGGEWDNYSSDITRTYPINGKFSPEQRQVYEIVLRSQKAGIEAIKPGLPWNEIQKTIIRVLIQGLAELGILKGAIDGLIEKEAHKPFYMHNSGHWLGLDTHDVGTYKVDQQWRPLKAGMVLTVEPGLYIKPSKNVDPRWWNIGIRIEDDIVVTDTGYEVLTSAAPKEIDEIETLMR